MANLILENLSRLQANKLAMMFEEDYELLDFINEEFKKVKLPAITVDDLHYDDTGDNIISFLELNNIEENEEDNE